MSRWYRAYSGTVKDDKLAEVAVIVGCSRSVAIATWHAILESAAECNDGGRFDTTSRRVAAVLGEPATVIDQVFQAMQELGMIEGQEVGAWKKRQFESDSSTERSRKHRETKRNGDATLQERSATPPYTETDTEHSQVISLPTVERKPSTAPQAAPTDFRGDLFERGRTSVEAMTGMPAPKARTLIGSWLKLANDEAVIVLEAIDAASEARPADPVPWIRRTIESRMRTRDPPKRVWGSV
jgi:hypothetical protein